MGWDGALTRSPLQTAAEYAALGLTVLPECPATCACDSPGKRPFDPVARRHLRGWQRRGIPTDGQLRAWLEADERRASGGAAPSNVGCRCGPGCLGEEGLVAADADGERGLVDLAPHLGLTPAGLRAAIDEQRETGIFRLRLGSSAYLTQSGGLRVLWRAPAGAGLRTIGDDKGHAGLRLMWAGQQIVLPPSVGPAGAYRWLSGHSPWQAGIAWAPGRVRAAMADPGREPSSRGAISDVIRAYPAASGDCGPDWDGRLVDASWLPYDLDLLRDGVAQGRRSETVHRLELQMLRAGWAAAQVVGALAAQPWVRAMRPDIVRWLRDDVQRATTWLDGQGPSLQDAAEAPRPTPPAAPERHHQSAGPDDDAAERAAIAAEGCILWPQAVGPSAAPNPDVDAEGQHPAPHADFARLRAGSRLRTLDRERGAAVVRGLGAVRRFVAALPHPTASQCRLLDHVERLEGSFERCRTRARARPHDLRHAARAAEAGGAWLWSEAPCDGRGHEDCAPYHALRELRAQWGSALEQVYGGLPVSALALSAPGWGLDATRRAATSFLAAAEVRRALGLCVGFLTFEAGEAPGYALHLVVPAHRARDLRGVLLRAWRRCVAVGWVHEVVDLPQHPTALEALVELRVRSEQSILLALGRGEFDRDRAINLYAAETGVFSGTNIGGQRQRLVVAPGMRRLAKDIASGREALAQAVGAAPSATPDGGSAVSPPAPEPQGAAGTGSGNAGKGPRIGGAFTVMAGAVPSGPSGSGAPGVPAGETPPPSPAAPSDDTGWVPCPWDPTLEMRPSRPRKGQPRALPWWKLERMAARGEVVPIIHDGRLIGYRTPPEREGRR